LSHPVYILPTTLIIKYLHCEIVHKNTKQKLDSYFFENNASYFEVAAKEDGDSCIMFVYLAHSRLFWDVGSTCSYTIADY